MLHRQLPEWLQAKFADVDTRPWLGRRIMQDVATASFSICNGSASERISKICLDYHDEKRGGVSGEFVRELDDNSWILTEKKLRDAVELPAQSIRCLTDKKPNPLLELETNKYLAPQIDFYESREDNYKVSYAYNTPIVLSGGSNSKIIPQVSARAYAFLNIKGANSLRPPVVREVDAIGLIHDEIFGTNYTHWLLDWFPRFYLLKSAGVDVYKLNYIMPYALTGFQRETLAAIGIKEHQIIVAPYVRDQPPTSVGARKIFGCNTSGAAFRHALHLGQSWAYDFIRSSLVKNTAKPHRKIILNRLENRRALFDEGAASLLRNEGFEEVFTEAMPLAEQIEIFSSATHVVGIHGAGMANLVFCSPETQVLEIFPESLATLAFWRVSKAGRLNYICCVGEQVDGDGKLIEHSRDVLTREHVVRSWFDEIAA